MTERCYRCGSANVQAINMEISFALLKAEPVYALAKPIVCLECGVVELTLSEDPLRKLRDGELVQAEDTPAGCPPLQGIA